MSELESFLSELHDAPQQIDIFVDGSWLHKGQRNPVEVGGWGAVVVEHYSDHESSWTPSNATSQTSKSSMDAEIEGAIGALQAVQERESHRLGTADAKPEVNLYTDVPDYIGSILQKDSAKAIILKELFSQMDVTLKPAHHDKTGGTKRKQNADDRPEMATAHHLASKAAWEERIKRQGGMNIEPKKR